MDHVSFASGVTLPMLSHPVLFLEHLQHDSAQYGALHFDFEAYEHRAQQGTLRHIVKAEECGLHKQVETLCSQLGPDEELGLRSLVHRTTPKEGPFSSGVTSSWLHVPCIDFCIPSLDDALALRIGKALAFVDAPEMYVYASGRSYHGYVNALAPYQEWVRFMGMMLLLNKLGEPPVTDVRWVGHKLKCGFGTMRMSANTKRHARTPALVRVIQPIKLPPGAAQDEDYC